MADQTGDTLNPQTAPASAQDREAPQTDSGDSTAPSAPDPAVVLGLLEDARSKADEHWNQLLRANAELENARKRARQDVENAHKYALERFVQELLPVKDSLEMGLAAATQSTSGVDASLRQGTELTLKMLEAVLGKFAVTEVDPLGATFDPALHQAVALQESPAHAPNTVMAVMQKGYRLNDRLIRPAMVVVAKAAVASRLADAGDTAEPGDQFNGKA